MKKINVLLIMVLILSSLTGCELTIYRVKLSEQEKEAFTQIAQDFLMEKYGENITRIENCYVSTAYSSKQQAETKKDEWGVCVYGYGKDDTVYNVIIKYVDKEVTFYSAKHPNGMCEGSIDDSNNGQVKDNRIKAANALGITEDSKTIRSVVTAINSISPYKTIKSAEKTIVEGQVILKVVYEDAVYGIVLDAEGYAIGIKNLDDNSWFVKPME